ncbi:MAG: Ig-like domain-containing protein [Candidatus Gracilibacteria bacterium]
MFKSLLPLLEHFLTPRKKNFSLEEFGALEKQLQKEQPKPRKAFEEALKKRLHQRYAELQEKRETQSDESFQLFGSWMRQWTLIPVALMLLMVIAGTGVYVTSPTPATSISSFGILNASVQPAFAPVMIAFDTPMLESSVEEAFSITPSVEGRFIWNEEGTTLYFLPKTVLAKDTTYQVTLTEQAKSRYFKPLASLYERTFTSEWIALTEPPPMIASGSVPPLSPPLEPSVQSAGAELLSMEEKEDDVLLIDDKIKPIPDKKLDPFAPFRIEKGPLTAQELAQFEAAVALMEENMAK